MAENLGRINVPKETMLFVTNSVFNQNIKENTTKENILKLIPELYRNANDIEIIKMLPYKAYLTLERLIEYVKHSDKIEDFMYDSKNHDTFYLEDAMIVVMRAKGIGHKYSINPGTLESLERIFSKENKEIAKRFGKIEELTKGILYSYGVIEINELRNQICKYMNENILNEELYDIYFKKLNLNMFINYLDINWSNIKKIDSFVTYLDKEEVDVANIAMEQKHRNFKYKKFTENEILKREEFISDKSTQKIYNFLKSRNKYLYDFQIENILKRNQLGENILQELVENIDFNNEDDIKYFMNLYMEWYNNSPQYILGGYSPNEFKSKV